MVSGLSVEESNSSIKGAFGLKDLVENVEDSVFIFHVRHVYERHSTRK